MLKTILIILGILALLMVIIKFITKDKEDDSLFSRMNGLADRFSSACKKILNFGC